MVYLKQNADKAKQAHGGIGASSHMACLLFNQALDIKPMSVAYRGTGPAMNDLLAGMSISYANNRSAWQSKSQRAR